MSDQWEALFDLWHEQAHRRVAHLGVLSDLQELDRRIVALEAYMRAARDERRLVRHKNDPGV